MADSLLGGILALSGRDTEMSAILFFATLFPMALAEGIGTVSMVDCESVIADGEMILDSKRYNGELDVKDVEHRTVGASRECSGSDTWGHFLVHCFSALVDAGDQIPNLVNIGLLLNLKSSTQHCHVVCGPRVDGACIQYRYKTNTDWIDRGSITRHFVAAAL